MPGTWIRLGIAGRAAIVIEDLHRRHAAARREVQPHDRRDSGYVILLSPSTLTHSTLVGAPSCSAVCTGPAGVRGPVADLAGAEIEKAAPVIGHVLRS